MKNIWVALYSVLFFIVMGALTGFIIYKIIKAPLLGFVWLIVVMFIWGFIHESSDGL